MLYTEVDRDMLPAAQCALDELAIKLGDLGLIIVKLREFRSGAVAATVRQRIRSKDKELLSKIKL